MADFLDKIKGKIDQGISTVNVKSKEILEKQKIKLQISELEAEKKNILLELGKLTHIMVESSDGVVRLKGRAARGKAADVKPDKWEQSVLSVLREICQGNRNDILFENTAKEFKITAKALSAEVQKSLPKSEQKGQNLQWLGRVLGKFGIASRKYSKRINRERETVYEFDKQELINALSNVKSGKSASTGKNTDYSEQILAKSKEINQLDTKIAKLEEKLSKVGV